MDVKDILSDLYNQIKDKWPSSRALILAMIVASLGMLWAFSVIDLSKIGWRELAVSTLVLFGIVTFWMFTRRPQRAPRNKVGFGIALVTEDQKQRKKIYHDFIVTMRNLLYRSKFRYQFAF